MEKHDELTKSLVDLIDETLNELEELKKSKFSAAEIKIEGPGEKDLAGKPVNGELDAKKADEDKDDDDEDDKKKKDDVEKGVLDNAEKSDKDEDEAEKKKKEAEAMKDKEEKACKSMPVVKADEEVLKKSLEAQESLIKSYVDSKFVALEQKLDTLSKAFENLKNEPVARKGIAAEKVAPLHKSEPEVKPLCKAEIADKLLELKKSGKSVATEDIVRIDIGSSAEVQAIARKYDLKV
jgi:hypothetical protein